MRHYFFYVFWGMITACSISPDYPVQGSFDGHSAQGMAIHEEYAFLLSDSGLCRVYDLKKKGLIRNFSLGSANPMNHANSASFGAEYLDKNSLFPCLYISECHAPLYRCFVENITLDSSVVVQTLQFGECDEQPPIHTWVVDAVSKGLYGLTLKQETPGDPCITVRRFRLPHLSEGNLVFTAKDVEKEFDIPVPNLLQGGTIYDNILYLPVGMNGKGNTKISERAMILVDLKQQKVINKIELNNLTNNEPEDADFYGDELLMYCGQEGGLWKIQFNNQ